MRIKMLFISTFSHCVEKRILDLKIQFVCILTTLLRTAPIAYVINIFEENIKIYFSLFSSPLYYGFFQHAFCFTIVNIEFIWKVDKQ